MNIFNSEYNSDILRFNLPDNISGEERIGLISTKLEQLPDTDRKAMRSHIESLLQYMTEIDASDIDFGGPGCAGRVWYRSHGEKKPSSIHKNYETTETNALLLNLISRKQVDFLKERGSIDFSFSFGFDEDNKPMRFRATIYMELDNLAMNMRKINNEIRPFKTLNLHPEAAKALSLNYLKFGLTLVTGITGSGKSSTLDTIIDANNRSASGHIVIISSPVELVHESKRCIVRHREVGRDVKSFRAGAVESLRQDPDIIMIGELRDEETIQTALEITDSGHKTFSTLHTASATESIDRIIGEINVNQQERVRNRLADVLTCVISQKLLPSTDGKRVMAKEVLLGTSSIKAAIRNNNLNEIYQMLTEGSALGMNTLEQELKKLFEERRITLESAMSYANNKTRMRELLNMD
jgi:twitching motility protein PilT